jgi:hypothetical protein
MDNFKKAEKIAFFTLLNRVGYQHEFGFKPLLDIYLQFFCSLWHHKTGKKLVRNEVSRAVLLHHQQR